MKRNNMKGKVIRGVLVASVGLLMSGCQLLSSQSKIEKVSREVKQSHAQNVAEISDHLDLYLSQTSRERFLKQVTSALESPSETPFVGKDKHTYASWTIKAKEQDWQAIEVKRPTEIGVVTDADLVFMDIPYRSNTKLNLRGEPGTHGEKLGVLSKGEVFNSMAQVLEEPWYLVEQKGVIRGYVHKDYVTTNVRSRSIIATQPNPLLYPYHDKQSEHKTDVPIEGVLGIYICRNLNYEIRKNEDVLEGSFKACRKQKNVWYIETPEVRGGTS
ncbi:SH3 domain-containing protein [Vibrio penaeicida]|uniref:SH3 domain-containing protein n=1 Tax=Vibrio penaeicida TaxID=104609 RepID=UPI001F447A03|nr:SH3 domain-containing protein [Vibrio penaeicida]